PASGEIQHSALGGGVSVGNIQITEVMDGDDRWGMDQRDDMRGDKKQIGSIAHYLTGQAVMRPQMARRNRAELRIHVREPRWCTGGVEVEPPVPRYVRG